MSICPVSRCASPRHPGWSVCRPCSNELRKNLAEAPAIARELEITLARLRSNAPRDGGHASPNRLPYVPEASEAQYVLRSCLVGWIRDLDENPANHPADTIEAMATWLLGRMNDLLVHPAAQEVVEEIAAAVGRPVTTRPRHMLPAATEGADPTPWSRGRAKVGEELYDNFPPRMFLGPCECGDDIYTAGEQLTARCAGCDAEYSVTDRMLAIEEEVATLLMPIRQIARIAAFLGDHQDTARSERRLNLWVHRGRLKRAGVDREGRATYRYRQALDLLDDVRDSPLPVVVKYGLVCDSYG